MRISTQRWRAMVALAFAASSCTRHESSKAPGTATAQAESIRVHAADTVAAGQSQLAPFDDIEVFPASHLVKVADELASGAPTNGGANGSPATLRYIETSRTTNGEPEVHDQWTDVTVVQAGHGKLLAGGKAEGTRLLSPGEHRGGTISGGESHVVSAGDSFIIPAGVPHQYMVAPGDSIRYLTIKVARKYAPRM